MRNGGSSSGRWDDLLAQDQSAPINNVTSPASDTSVALELGSSLITTPSLYKGRDTAFADESEIP